MSRIARMLLLGGGSPSQDHYREDGGPYTEPQYRNYEAENRFRDRRGREHYDNGRFAPMNDGGIWVDSRYDEPQGHYPSPMPPYAPPVYERDGYGTYGRYPGRRDYDGVRSKYPMDKIGFAMEGEIEHPMETRHHRMDRQMGGYVSSHDYEPLTREKAEKWVEHMKNADGSTGPRWPLEQTKQIQAQHGIGLDPIKFWVAMNMMFSDYSKVAEKAGISTTDFYADMAKAFLTDKDAQPDKLDRYYHAIAEQ